MDVIEDKLKKMKEELNRPVEVDSDTFKLYRNSRPNDILRCANQFSQNNKI